MRHDLVFASAAALAAALLPLPAPAVAGDIPSCALSGSTSVMIGGRPALRMSDVVNCPAELIELIPGIQIDGQPMVRLRSGTSSSTDCVAGGDGTVQVDGKQAQSVGDVICKDRD